MQLGRLDEVAQPARRAQVGVVEVFAGSSEEVVPERAEQRAAKQRIKYKRAQDCIAQDLDRMLVERRQNLDARWRVVNLVEHEPPSFRMTRAMPPVKEKRTGEPADEAFKQRRIPVGK